MNGNKQFNSQMVLGRGFAETISNESIKREPMFFNSGRAGDD